MPPMGVKGPDGQTYQFPPDATDAEILSFFQETPKAPAPVPSSGGGILEAGKNLLVGAGKGMTSTAIGATELINKGTSAVGLTKPIKSDVFDRARADLATPEGTAQTIGYGVEQVGEMFVPVGGAAKAVSMAPKIAKTARMVGEGVEQAAKSAVQSGGDTTATVAGGVMGAGGQAVAGAISKIPFRAQAEQQIARALGAQKERFKAIAAKRAPEIIRRGIGGSRQSVLKEATENAKAAGNAIDTVLQTAGGQRVPTQPIVTALEDAKAGFRVTGPRGKPVTVDDRPVQQLSELQRIIKRLGSDADVDQLVAIRRVWDDVVDQAGGYAHRGGGSQFGVPLAEKTEAWAKREGASAIRKELAKAVPDLKAVNAEYAFWSDLKSVLRATEARTQAQNQTIQRLIPAGIGTAYGATTGDTVGESIQNAVIGGVVAPKAVQMLTSARWRFVDAKLRNALADAIDSGSAGRIAAAASRIAAAGTNQTGN